MNFLDTIKRHIIGGVSPAAIQFEQAAETELTESIDWEKAISDAIAVCDAIELRSITQPAAEIIKTDS